MQSTYQANLLGGQWQQRHPVGKTESGHVLMDILIEPCNWARSRNIGSSSVLIPEDFLLVTNAHWWAVWHYNLFMWSCIRLGLCAFFSSITKNTLALTLAWILRDFRELQGSKSRFKWPMAFNCDRTHTGCSFSARTELRTWARVHYTSQSCQESISFIDATNMMKWPMCATDVGKRSVHFSSACARTRAKTTSHKLSRKWL